MRASKQSPPALVAVSLLSLLTLLTGAIVAVTPATADAADGPAIVEFWLIDADSDIRIQKLDDYSTLRLPFLPQELSIEAVASSDTDSVLLEIDGAHSSTENLEPYALRGDASGDFNPVPELRVPGWINVSAQAFSGPDNTGTSGAEARLRLYLHQPDFVVRNPGDTGDWDPGDGVCSIGPVRFRADDYAVVAHKGEPAQDLKLRADFVEETKASVAAKAATLAPVVEVDERRSSTETKQFADKTNPIAKDQIARFVDESKGPPTVLKPVEMDIPKIELGRDAVNTGGDAGASLKELGGTVTGLIGGFEIERFEPLIPIDWFIPTWFPAEGCTLRAAIEEANALAGRQSILIDSTRGPFELSHGHLAISEGLDLIGVGHRALIDGKNSSRIFYVAGDHIVNMRSLDLARGNPGTTARGGAMWIDDDALVQMSDSIVRQSQANYGGGIYLQSGGDLTLTDSAIRDNIAGTPEDGITGGGITQRGGGIFNLRGNVTVRDSAIFDNMAVRGGGLSNYGGTMRIENSSVIDNEALAIAGGIENHHTAERRGNLHLAFATVAYNEAGTSFAPPASHRVGGGLYNTGWAYMASSILAANTDGYSAGDPLHAPDCYSPDRYDFKSYRNNVVGVLNDNCDLGDYSWGTTAWIDHGTEGSPLDARLLNKLSWDHRQYRNIGSDSPALDGGASQTASLYPCADNDGRDRVRPVGEGCDIGAIERQ